MRLSILQSSVTVLGRNLRLDLLLNAIFLIHNEWYVYKQVLKDTPVFASIVGGYNMSERLRCIKSLNEFEVSGYILDGFHTNGDSATNLKWEDVEPVLTDTLVNALLFFNEV